MTLGTVGLLITIALLFGMAVGFAIGLAWGAIGD